MTTLFDIALAVQRKIGDGKRATAGASTTTTLVCTDMNEADDFWNGGTVFFISGVTLLNNTSAVVSDFAAATDTATLPTQAAAPTGAVFEIYTQRFSKQAILKAVNQALESLEVPDWDESTAVTADTLRYALPAGVRRVRRVEVGTHTDGWEEHHYWREQDGYILFTKHEPTDTDDYIRLEYAKTPASVSGDSSTIDNAIPLHRLVLEAVVNCLRFRLFQVGTDEPNTETMLKDYMQQLAIERNRSPIEVKHAAKFAHW